MSVYYDHKISAYSIRKGFDSFENYLNHDIDEIESIEELEEQAREYFWHVWLNMGGEEQAIVLNDKFGYFLDFTNDCNSFVFHNLVSGEFLSDITFYTCGSDGEEVVDDAMNNNFHGSPTLKVASESVTEVVNFQFDFKQKNG